MLSSSLIYSPRRRGKSAFSPADAWWIIRIGGNGLASHRDGRTKIGEGQMPGEAWKRLFAGLPGIPAVMETPYGGLEADEGEVQLVKKLAGGLPVSPEEV